MVEGEKPRALARRRGLSRSASVREALDFELLAEEFEEAMLELSAMGGIDDVFGTMPVGSGDEAAERNRARS